MDAFNWVDRGNIIRTIYYIAVVSGNWPAPKFLYCDIIQSHLIYSFFNENNFYINASWQEMLICILKFRTEKSSELICTHPFRLFMLHIRSFWKLWSNKMTFNVYIIEHTSIWRLMKTEAWMNFGKFIT